MRLGSAPATSAMTWLIRRKVSVSMPLARLTRVASVGMWGAQVARLSLRVWLGTARTTMVAPHRAWVGLVVAVRVVGSWIPGR